MRIIAALLVSSLVLQTACRQSVKQRRYRAETGIASKIDLETGKVSMSWLNARTGKSELLSGRVTQATEIMINGISARLEDIRPGDPVTVIVYWDDEHQQWIVTSAAVQREKSYMLEKPLPTNGSP